jgi:hypothetical protein
MPGHRSEGESMKLPRIGKWIAAIALMAIIAASYQAGHRSAERASVPGRPGTAVAPAVGSADIRAGVEPTGVSAATGSGSRPRAAAAVTLPAGSIDEILALPGDFVQTYAAYALAAQADEDALRGLIEDAKRVERDNDRLSLIAILIGRYGEIDPERALDYIAGSDLENKPGLVHRVVRAWSKVDLDAAIAALSELDGQEQMAATDAILSAYSDVGQAVLADVRARLAEPAVDAGPSLPTVLRLAMSDPAAALTEASRLGQDRMAAIFAIGASWVQTDPEAALAHSRSISDPAIRDALQRGIFVAWVDRDPATVLRFLEPDANETERNAILNAGLVRLAQGDPRRAFTEVGAVEDAALRSVALQRVFRAWAQQDPAVAAAALDEVVAEDDMATLGYVVGREFALRSPAAALDWAASFDDDSGIAYRTVLTEAARIDAQIALDSAFAISGQDERSGAFGLILSTVAEQDPVAAAGYWQQVPAEARADAAAALVTRWQAQDPGAAADWLLGLRAGPDRDAGLGRFVAAASNDDPDVLSLLNAMSSPENRDRSALNRIRNLARAGLSTQAETELGQIDLSPDAYREAIAAIDANR